MTLNKRRKARRSEGRRRDIATLQLLGWCAVSSTLEAAGLAMRYLSHPQHGLWLVMDSSQQCALAVGRPERGEEFPEVSLRCLSFRHLKQLAEWAQQMETTT